MIDFEKILRDIRSKPERERMRYLYGAVGIVMLFVIFIWILSLQVTFHDLRPDPTSSSSIDAITDKLNESLGESDAPSIEDLIQEGQETRDALNNLQDLTAEQIPPASERENQ